MRRLGCGYKQEIDIRYVVTDLESCQQRLYENVDCQRG